MRHFVRMLLDAGAKDDSALARSLIAAVSAKNMDDVKWLLDAGANKDAKSEVRSCGAPSRESMVSSSPIYKRDINR